MRTLCLTLLIFIITTLFSEYAVQQYWTPHNLLPPSVNTNHLQFNIQFTYLKQWQDQHGDIECLLLGNSMTLAGLNPEVIKQAYQMQTDDSLECFNFGIRGANPTTIAQLLPLILQYFEPKIMILGISARDFSDSTSDINQSIFDSDWYQFFQGNFTWQGQLYWQSALYQQV